MAKRTREPIKTCSYVKDKEGNWIPFKSLPPEKKAEAATKLALTYFNTLYQGKAVFYEAGKEPET
jgi:hypothetical protein